MVEIGMREVEKKGKKEVTEVIEMIGEMQGINN